MEHRCPITFERASEKSVCVRYNGKIMMRFTKEFYLVSVVMTEDSYGIEIRAKGTLGIMPIVWFD